MEKEIFHNTTQKIILGTSYFATDGVTLLNLRLRLIDGWYSCIKPVVSLINCFLLHVCYQVVRFRIHLFDKKTQMNKICRRIASLTSGQ
jgi:hypothetical protein